MFQKVVFFFNISSCESKQKSQYFETLILEVGQLVPVKSVIRNRKLVEQTEKNKFFLF